MVGFEPTVHGTKNRCLTTWLHPSEIKAQNVKRICLFIQDSLSTPSNNELRSQEIILQTSKSFLEKEL